MTTPPQPPYGVGPYAGGGGYAQPKQNGMAIASLVTGILALPGMCCWAVGLILGALGLVFGFMGKKQIEESGGMQTGAGMALAGIICGGIAVALSVLFFILWMTIGFSTWSYDIGT